MNRRPLLISVLAAAAFPGAAFAAQKKSLADPLLLGVDQSLIDTGLAQALQRGFGRDTGVAVKLVPGTSAWVLDALEKGEVDASLTNAAELEMRLEKQGLAHDRLHVADGDLLLVGPVEGKGKKATDPVGMLGERDAAATLVRIALARAPFVSAPAGSGAALAETSLWRAAKVSPVAPWYTVTPTNGDALALATERRAYTLVERSIWIKQRSRKPLEIIVEGDPRLTNEVHLMRSFRVNHPAAKLFGQWVSGRQGRRVAGTVRGWRSPR